jgi:hypothetical protein
VVVSSSIDNPISGKEHRTEADHIQNVIKMKPKGGIRYEGKLSPPMEGVNKLINLEHFTFIVKKINYVIIKIQSSL